ATHALDHALFRNNGVMLHLHSALWSLFLLFGVRALYRALITDRFVANLALALYALDDARGWLVSWVAARNAAIATAFSVWTLVVHHRGRERSRSWQWLFGPGLFALALFAGEGALATVGYLLGYALFLDRGSWQRRLGTLVPYALVALAWRVIYLRLGYGAHGSGLYIDPFADPRGFVRAVWTHAPMLLGAQFGGVWSDTTLILFVSTAARVMMYCVTWFFIAWMIGLMLPQFRTSPLARFAGLGALIALPPACLVAPTMDRLLTWVAIGACICTAQLFAPVLRGAPGLSAPLRLTTALLVAAGLVSVAFLPSRARGNLVMRDTLDRAQAAIPRDASVTDKTLIWVNPPLLPYAGYIPIERAAQGIPRPRAQHILADGAAPLHLLRVDPYTLRLRPRDGFLVDPLTKLLWSEQRPFHAGERIQQADLTVTVTQIMPDGRPREIEARFDRPLEDPKYLWVHWQGARSVRFTPPAVGARAILAGADYFQVVLGLEFPFAARL
ncbi:MAG TPA: hypothetical protein VHM19_09885, partial [Polyangiales bacterium]|nr:hypothetical protein [Polyangiales bacterium]